MEGALVTRGSEVFEPLHTMAEINSYYKWCMFFLSVIGLWPYSSKKVRLLQNGIISLVISVSIISQILVLFAGETNLFRLLRIVSITAMAIVSFSRYHATWYQIDDMKTFLDQIRLDWKTNNDEILQIMQIHAFYGKRHVIIFAAFVYPSVCMVILYQILPITMDIIVPLNVSRPVQFPIDADILVDEEQHPILYTFLLYLLLIVDVTVFVGTESLMIMIFTHIAGSFQVASYYFQKAVLAECSASLHPRDCTNSKTINYMVSGVTVHRVALQFTRDLNRRCIISYIPAIMLGVIALSIHLFCLSQTVLQLSDIRETMLSVLLLTSTLGYMFWLHLTAQYMIDSADSIPLATYNANWYETSIATQKLLQLIILYSNRGSTFNFLSVYVASIEGFAVLLKTSVSYFTLLLSLQ